MTIEYLLAMVGPGLLGGALAYFIWAKIDARGAKPADTARKTETPPVTTAAAEDAPPTPRELPIGDGPGVLVMQQTDAAAAPDGAERPTGADPAMIVQTDAAQQDAGALEALRSDVAELATSLLSVHETMTQKATQDADQAPAFKELTERLDRLSAQVTEGQAPDRIAAAIVAQMPETPAPSLPEAFATLPARVDQLASALTAALGGLPEDIRRAVAESPAKAPDLSALEAQLEAMSARIPDRDDTLLEGLKSDLAGIASRLESSETDPAALPEALQGMRQDIAGLAAAQIPPLDTSPMLDRLTAMEAKIDSLTASETPDVAGLLTERLAELEERLATAVAQPADIDTRLTALEDRTVAALAGLGEAMKDTLSKQAVPPSTDSTAALQERVDRISAAVTGIGGRLAGIEGLDTRLTGLESALKEEIRDAALFARGPAEDPAPAGAEPPPDLDVPVLTPDTAPAADSAATEAPASDLNEGSNLDESPETPASEFDDGSQEEIVEENPESAEETAMETDADTAAEADPFADVLSALAGR